GENQKSKSYVGVFDGRDGVPVAQFPIRQVEGLALSPDRRLLAVGQRIEVSAKKPETQPTVLVVDVASGKMLATLVHDTLRLGSSKNFLYGAVRVQFTADGKYLISSGLNTKVWQLTPS